MHGKGVLRVGYFLSTGFPCRAPQDFEKAGQLRDREMELKAQISAITGAAKEGEEAEAEATADGGGPLVTEQDIANIVAQWTGIPVEKVPALAVPVLVCTQSKCVHRVCTGDVSGP